MARRNKNKIKELGDQKLVTEIEKLQNQLALEQDLDQNTLDLSDRPLFRLEIQWHKKKSPR